MEKVTVQTISCQHCHNTFAVCSAPECYTDAEWHRTLRNNAKKGRVIAVTTSDKYQLSKCTCKKYDVE